jgi:hypothetical protein
MNSLSYPQPDEAPPFADEAGDIEISFEFFPPKTEKMDLALWETVQTLAPLGPRFISVTYGAGGSTRERTHATLQSLPEVSCCRFGGQQVKLARPWPRTPWG